MKHLSQNINNPNADQIDRDGVSYRQTFSIGCETCDHDPTTEELRKGIICRSKVECDGEKKFEGFSLSKFIAPWHLEKFLKDKEEEERKCMSKVGRKPNRKIENPKCRFCGEPAITGTTPESFRCQRCSTIMCLVSKWKRQKPDEVERYLKGLELKKKVVEISRSSENTDEAIQMIRDFELNQGLNR